MDTPLISWLRIKCCLLHHPVIVVNVFTQLWKSQQAWIVKISEPQTNYLPMSALNNKNSTGLFFFCSKLTFHLIPCSEWTPGPKPTAQTRQQQGQWVADCVVFMDLVLHVKRKIRCLNRIWGIRQFKWTCIYARPFLLAIVPSSARRLLCAWPSALHSSLLKPNPRFKQLLHHSGEISFTENRLCQLSP